MTPSEVQEFLIGAIRAGHNVLLTGAAGVGKTAIVEAAALKAGSDLVVFYPAISDQSKIEGLPMPSSTQANVAEFYPYGDIQKLIMATKRTTAFLDDFGQTPFLVQGSWMHAIHPNSRQAGDKKLSPEVHFIAATNRREDCAGVSGLLEPVKSRFMTIIEVVPSTKDWIVWGIRKGVEADLLGYVAFDEGIFSGHQANYDLTNSPSPRTLENADKVLKMHMSAIVEYEALKGAAGEKFAANFQGFRKLAPSLRDIEAILKNPSGWPIPEQRNVLFAIATALATKATVETSESIVTFSLRLPREFAVFMVELAGRFCPALPESCPKGAFSKFAVKFGDVYARMTNE